MTFFLERHLATVELRYNMQSPSILSRFVTLNKKLLLSIIQSNYPVNEKTYTFPTVAPRGLEPDQFRHYLTDALNDFYGFLTTIAPEHIGTIPWKIWRKHQTSITKETILFPDYRRLFFKISLRDEALEQLPGVSALLDYIWNRGEFQITWQSSREITRRDWERYLLVNYLYHPLCKVLNEAAIEEAVDCGHVSCWRFPQEYRCKLIDELVFRYCENKYRFMARCALLWASGQVGSCYNLGQNLTLKIYDEREALIQDSRNGYQSASLNHQHFFLDNDHKAVLEITSPIRPENFKYRRELKLRPDLFSGPVDLDVRENIKEQVYDFLDIVKWAFTIVYPQSVPLREGPIICQADVLGLSNPFGIHIFQRQFEKGGISYELTPDKLENVKKYISKALCYREQSQDIKTALWHWGRACIAELKRDRLMEAIIGLESLLVPNPGESRYRFGLHGAALLAQTPEECEVIAKELRNLYDNRSTIAHGKRAERLSADDAFKYLGQAIQSIINLFDANLLKPKNPPISKQIERLVLHNSFFARLLNRDQNG